MYDRKLVADLVANSLRGALPPDDLRAVCFVLAIVDHLIPIAELKCNKK